MRNHVLQRALRRAGLGRLVALVSCAVLGGCGGAAECGDCYAEGYRVDLSSAPRGTNPPPAVLFSGWRNGWCQEDLICTGTPDVFLGHLSFGPLPWHMSCEDDEQELIAFAGGHAPSVAAFDPTADGVSINLSAPARVDVAVWIVGGAVLPADAQTDVESTGGILTDLGTGIDLHLTGVQTFPRTVAGLEEEASCTDANAIADPAGGGYYADQVNIYYVPKVQGNAAARDCYQEDPAESHPNIIFARGTLGYSPVALAHELGHAFGLVRPAPIPGTTAVTLPGHVDELYLDQYLAEDNLMISGSVTVSQATVGQIYRMHFDELSWLWHNREPEGHYPRTCQGSVAEGGPCPPLTLNPPRGWP